MANASSTTRHLALEQTSGAEEAPLHRSDISTETGKGLFGRLPKLAVTTPTHLCDVVARLRQCTRQTYGAYPTLNTDVNRPGIRLRTRFSSDRFGGSTSTPTGFPATGRPCDCS